jgi:hypothetical protein
MYVSINHAMDFCSQRNIKFINHSLYNYYIITNILIWCVCKQHKSNCYNIIIIKIILINNDRLNTEKIKTVIMSHFVLDDIITAKNELWANADEGIIGDRKRRRDGSNKSEKESHVLDIITALYQLDGEDKNTRHCHKCDGLGLYTTFTPRGTE